MNHYAFGFGTLLLGFLKSVNYANDIDICLRSHKSKQSYVWMESIFEGQNICFGCEIAGLLESPIISAL